MTVGVAAAVREIIWRSEMRQRHELLLWAARSTVKSRWFAEDRSIGAQQAARLIESNRWNLGRRIVLAVAVTWVPLVLITLLFNSPAIRSLVDDYFVNTRSLFACRCCWWANSSWNKHSVPSPVTCGRQGCWLKKS